MATAAKRAEMLLFAFDGALFQLAQREPALEPLFQLPPRMTAHPSTPASVWCLFCFLQSLYPTAKHRANFSNQGLSSFKLMLSEHLAPVMHHETQEQAQLRETAIEHVALAQLIRLDRSIQMLSNQKQLTNQKLTKYTMLSWDALRDWIDVVHNTLILFDHVKTISLLGGIRRGSFLVHDRVGAVAPPSKLQGARPQNAPRWRCLHSMERSSSKHNENRT